MIRYVIVVVDSHIIQRIVVLATEETTVIQHVSHRPIRCQSRLWPQRGTKVNGSHHHGNNPLLRPTGIQIATETYATLQAMAPINVKTVHQTSLLHTESNLDRLGLLSPTHDQRSQQQTGQQAKWSAGQENIRRYFSTKLNHWLTSCKSAELASQEGHSVERVWYITGHGLTHPIPPSPGSQLLRSFQQKGITSRRSYILCMLRVFTLPYRRSRRHFGSPWIAPINAALKLLKLATVTPGATSNLSAPSASLFLCRFSGASSSSLTLAAINLQPPSHTVVNQNSRV